jgi:flagellar basal body-associated protein FliL
MEKDEKINGAVRTYTEDMAEVLENDTQGLVKKIIHGAKEHEQEQENLSPESKKNKFFMIVSILLIVLALLTLSFFIFKNSVSNTVPVVKQFVPIIFNDQSTYIEVSALNKDEIIQTVLNEINATKVQAGGVEGIYLTENKQMIGLRRFIALIKSSFIPGNNTLFVNDNFLMGAVQTGLKSTSPTAGNFFILLKVRSNTDIFNSLRLWEPKLLNDLRGFFGISISSDTSYLLTKSFQDGIVENKNARILYDNNGKIAVMYIFADDNSIVITDSQEAAHEIILRLTSGQTKQ